MVVKEVCPLIKHTGSPSDVYSQKCLFFQLSSPVPLTKTLSSTLNSCLSLREIVYNDDGSIYLRKPRHEFKVDDKVLVRNVGDSSWTRRHFCRYSEEGYIECYSSGHTSFTVNDTVIWDEIKPYEEEL